MCLCTCSCICRHTNRHMYVSIHAHRQTHTWPNPSHTYIHNVWTHNIDALTDTHPPTHKGHWKTTNFLQLIFIVIREAAVNVIFHAPSRDIRVFQSGPMQITENIFCYNNLLLKCYLSNLTVDIPLSFKIWKMDFKIILLLCARYKYNQSSWKTPQCNP